MRDYLSRIVKTAGNTVAHPTAARAILAKRPAYVAAAFLVALVTVFAVLRIVKAEGPGTPVNSNVVNKTTIESTTKADSTVAEETPQAVAEGDQEAMNASNNENQSSSTQTNVTVNGQKVDVPQNGSVSKTIQSEDGKTTVNISSSSTSNSSNTSNSLNVSTFSNSAGTNSTQINRYMH